MTLAFLVVSSIVWGAVLVASCIILQRITDASGRARQWIWRAAALLLVAPWLAGPLVDALGLGLAPNTALSVELGFETLPVDPSVIASEALVSSSVETASTRLPSLQWEQLLFIALAAGWIVRFVAAQLGARSLGKIIAASAPADETAARQALAPWMQRLRLRRAPKLRMVDAGLSPFSFGVLRPVVCLPEGLDRRLDAEALDLVVGHECVHVVRGDGWRRPIERLIADIFWFNPFAWRIRRELDMARELACDEAVVELTSARRAYARTLREVAGLVAGLSHGAPAASMSLAGGGRSLLMRVSRTLADARRRPARTTAIAATLLGLIGAPIAVAQVVLATPRPPRPPSPPSAFAQDEPPAIPATPALPPTAASGPSDEEPPLPPVPPLPPLEPTPAPTQPLPVLPAPPPVTLRTPDLQAIPAPRPLALPTPAPLAPLGAPAPVPTPGTRSPPTPQPARFDQAPPAPTAPEDSLLRIIAPAAVVASGARVTSGYGYRMDPFTNKMAFHEGVDLAQTFGAPIYAPADGVVTFAGTKALYGRVVELAVTSDIELRFGHLASIEVAAGDKIKAGDVVGAMGSTGPSTGPHLHFEYYWNGKPYDPLTVEGLRLIGR